jgi:hypothetical protein
MIGGRLTMWRLAGSVMPVSGEAALRGNTYWRPHGRLVMLAQVMAGTGRGIP